MSLRELIDDLRERHSHHPSLQAQIKVYTAHHWLKTIPGKNGPDLGKRDMDQALDALYFALLKTTHGVGIVRLWYCMFYDIILVFVLNNIKKLTTTV